jgi:hypothetical protein
MLCPHCGNQLTDSAKFCSKCGQKLVAEPVKTKTSLISGPIFANIGFWLLLTALYAGITAVFFILQSQKSGLGVQSLYHDEVISKISLGRFLRLLTNGNRIFNPTVVSKALGMGLRILYWLVPILGALALTGTILNKNAKRLCVGASVVIGITALLTATIVPLTLWLVPGVREAVAIRAGIVVGDVGGVNILWPILMAVGALALMVGVNVITAVFLNWRAKK